MGDNKVVRMRYNQSEYVEMQVHDPDGSNIVDLFVYLLEGAAKIGMTLPEQPTLWYAHNSRNFELKSDSDLMNMFKSLHEKRLINLAIGCGDSPCKNLELARGLIESKRLVENSTTRSSHGTTSLIFGQQDASMNSQSHHRVKKIPATTARRRGLQLLKVGNNSRSSRSASISSNLSTTKVVDVQAGDMLGVDAAGFVVEKGDVAGVVAEDDNVPDVVSEGGDVVGIVVEDEDVADFLKEYDLEMDKEDYFDKLYDNGEFYEDHDFGKINLKEWMIFMDKSLLIDVVRDYCVQEGFAIVVIKNEQKQYTAMCANSECDWRIQASRLLDGHTWAIKALKNIHTFMRLGKNNPMATAEWATRKILQDVSANESITGKTINSILYQAFGINLKTTSFYKAKKLAEEMLNGDEGKSYASLPGYCEVLKISNPDSKVHCVWRAAANDPERPIQFKSVFIALKPMIEGFIMGCRGLIGVDGCHLKGKFGGVVLSAIALDGDNQIFPVAFGVYENESKDTWSSFFYHLRELLVNVDYNQWMM